MFRKNLVVHHQQHCTIYCITQFGAIVQASLAVSKQLDSPARLYLLYSVIRILCRVPDDERLVSFEICTADKKTVELKIDYKNCAFR